MNITENGMTETRQQVERWIEESQYLLGRHHPNVFEDQQPVRERTAGAEADCDRMREEIAALRREVHDLHSELTGLRGLNDQLKSQQSAITESLSRAVHHM